MIDRASLTGAHLRTPRAAAIAGMVFALLLMTSLTLLRLSVPFDPLDPGIWLTRSSGRVAFALNLVPFAGIAFLWFIGVLRDRLGDREDRFFATVFLGSGLLFLTMLFVAAAAAAALTSVSVQQVEVSAPTPSFRLARALSYSLMNIYAVKAAAVFMFTTSTIALFTGIAARWIAYLGYALGLLLLFASGLSSWTFLVFPMWVLLLSGDILIDNLRRSPATEANR
jgi:hypothetical protein